MSTTSIRASGGSSINRSYARPIRRQRCIRLGSRRPFSAVRAARHGEKLLSPSLLRQPANHVGWNFDRRQISDPALGAHLYRGYLDICGFFLLLQMLVAITSPQHGDWFALAIPALMLIGIATMYFVGQKLGEAEEQAVLSYIRDQLEASSSTA